jgi:hypothetical protein
VKASEIKAYQYMLAYYYNVKHDKAAAIEWNNKILALDPNDEGAKQNDKALKAQPAKTSKGTTSPSKK